MIGHDAIKTSAHEKHFGVDITQAYLLYIQDKWTIFAGKYLAFNGPEN